MFGAFLIKLYKLDRIAGFAATKAKPGVCFWVNDQARGLFFMERTTDFVVFVGGKAIMGKDGVYG